MTVADAIARCRTALDELTNLEVSQFALAHWLCTSYRNALVVGPREHWPFTLRLASSLEAALHDAKREIARARQAARTVAGNVADHLPPRVHIVRVRDHEGTFGFAPIDVRGATLAARGLSLFAAEYLTCPQSYVVLAKRPRVLVAEDDADVRELVVAALRLDGCDVQEARDGHELLEKANPSGVYDGTNHPPDIVVTDVRMPGVDGLSVLGALRKTGWATPIVVITALGAPVCDAAFSLGANAVFGKPFDVAKLRTTVLNLLGTGGWRATAPTIPNL